MKNKSDLSIWNWLAAIGIALVVTAVMVFVTGAILVSIGLPFTY